MPVKNGHFFYKVGGDGRVRKSSKTWLRK